MKLLPGTRIGTKEVATLDSPNFIGTPTAPTPTDQITNNIATTEYVERSLTRDFVINRYDKDSEGIFTVFEKRRRQGASSILYERSVLSGGTSPRYTTRTVTRYDMSGAVLRTTVYTLSYDSDGDLIAETLS